MAKDNNGKFLSGKVEKILANKTKLKWKCNKCNHQWLAIYSLIKRGSWCPCCAGVKRVTIDDCKLLAKQKGGKCLSDQIKNSYTKLTWSCSYNHIWESAYSDIKKGRWCPLCLNKNQTKIYKYCKEMFPKKNIFCNYTGFDWLKSGEGTGRKMELDIFIPDLKLGIEYDGEQHFQPVRFGGVSLKKATECFLRQKERDIIKNKLIKEHPEDINVFIRISYKEKINKKNIKNIIKKALNETSSRI